MADVQVNPSERLRQHLFTAMALLEEPAPVPSGLLFHYTGADAFKEIVLSGSLHLSNASYLNDPAELEYPLGVLGEAVKDILGANGLNEEEEAFLRQVQGYCGIHRDAHYWYLVSFSVDGDLLSQWRAYCPHGGYSLGLSSDAVSKLVKKAGMSIGLVNYDRAVHLERVHDTWNTYLNLFRNIRDKHQDLSAKDYGATFAMAVALVLQREFLFWKNDPFREERECRIVASGYRATLDFKVRRGTLVPYQTLNLGQTEDGGRIPLEEVRVAPLGEPTLAENSARLLLEKCRYEKTTLRRAHYTLKP